MPHRFRKIRKLRGSRTCGWGRVGQHRKHGMKGGRGWAGGHKHKWTYVVKYAPNHFGKRGFRCPTSMGEVKALNVGELNELLDKLVNEGKVEFKDGKYLVNLFKLGYEKLLGEGEISRPVIVEAKSFSKKAEEKILGAGGSIIKV
ncbi:MAG: 50S ribosomal protein L15 [Candidatus Bathyarchaeota archaeon]|nr:50S ribosomal protein L15 [Candidatus Bathyarchaeota archaeon]